MAQAPSAKASEHRPTGWTVLAWTAMNGLGFVGGSVLAQATTQSLSWSPDGRWETTLRVAASTAIVGLGLGLGQWIVLRRYVNVPLWAPVTALAWGIMGLAANPLESNVTLDFYGHLGSEVIWDVTKGLMIGGLVGAGQGLIFHAVRIRRAGFWTIGTAASYAIAIGMASLLWRLPRYSSRNDAQHLINR
jgi:hypothetical protein